MEGGYDGPCLLLANMVSMFRRHLSRYTLNLVKRTDAGEGSLRNRALITLQ